MEFAQLLRSELDARRRRNPQYSLRAFARDLRLDHSALSQILRARRNTTPRLLLRLSDQLGLRPAEVAELSARAHDQKILRLARSPDFQPATRWIATRTGISIDDVNIALHRLIARGRLQMTSTKNWKITPNHHA